MNGIITTSLSKKNKEISFKYPSLQDAYSMTQYFNDLSFEDTFVYFSNRIVKEEHVLYYLQMKMKRLQEKTGVHILCWYNNIIIGNCHIEKDLMKETRADHVASLGISIHQNYRGEGIGELLLRTTIERAKVHMPGIQLIRLEVFSNNNSAQALYKKIGFVEAGRIPKGILYRGRYVDEITMCMPLVEA